MMKSGRWLFRRMESFQGKHSSVGAPPVFSNDLFPWTKQLEGACADIRKELDRILEHPEDIPAFHQLSPDQSRISRDDNCGLCPKTAALLDDLPRLQNAWFSILAPHYHIPPHRGPTRAVIRAHLGLIVPEDSQNCWIRVDQEIHPWAEGKCLVFDDTYEHEVRNDTEDRRVVLFLDFDRPMDRIGRMANAILIGLLRNSAYVRDPMRNLAAWNRKRRHAG